MKFSKKILETFIDLPKDWQELMEDVGLEVKSTDGDIFNLELLANRGDHYCYLGLATEINGRTGSGLKSIDISDLNYTDSNRFSIDTDKCIVYSLVPFDITNIKSPNADKMLTASGVNVIHPAIDVTNMVMLELGQPAHVYDADKIKGQIKIRETKAGEKAPLLFHEGETELPKGTVVIADDEKILCVAGVIGCHGADVDEDTKTVLFETAVFDPVSIRKAARALGVCTIASQRFERGGNLDAVKMGGMRANYLYNKFGAKLSGDAEYSEKVQLPAKEIEMSGDYVRSELEIEISDSEIDNRLSRYGFSKSGNSYIVPNVRIWDIKGEKADLIEELCRSIGYNNLPNNLPAAQIGSAPTDAEIRKSKIDSYLVNTGFFEVFTDNLYSPKHAELSPVKKHISLENSEDGAYAFIKNNCIVQAAELVSVNLARKNREIRAFEWGKIFPNGASEKSVLWGVLNGANVSPLTAKGLIESLMQTLDLDFQICYDMKVINEDEESLLMPKRSGWIISDNKKIGYFGEMSPKLLNQFDIKNDRPVYFAFDTDVLLNVESKTVKYESPSNTMTSSRDISVSVPYGVSAGCVSEFIADKYNAKIANVKIVDVFEKPKESIRNVTFALSFSGQHSAEELNKLILEIMNDANDFAKK